MDTQNCGLDLDHLARQTMGDEELQKQGSIHFCESYERDNAPFGFCL